MNLKQTVSEILQKEVTEAEAQKFASQQFGVLCAYIRKNKPATT
jgi:hypothetical protein